jgi:hypothetical protein
MSTRKGIGDGRAARQHEMSVARVEAEGDASTGLVQRDALGPDRPFAGERPMVEAQGVA